VDTIAPNLSKSDHAANLLPKMPFRADPFPSSVAPLRVVVLEHDDALREQVLLPGLRRYEFEVDAVRTTGELQQALMNAPFDLCVLDTVLSYGDGVSLPRWLRSQYPQIGITILSDQADPFDHLRGLNEGADAYLVKPVQVEIVAATLSSIARRMQRPPAAPDAQPAPRTQWQLQSDGWCLVSPDGAQVTLTISERRLVQVLWQHSGTLVSRETLMLAVTNGQGSVGEIDPHGLDMLLYRLRRKVQSRARQTLPLEVVRGAGYILHRQAPAARGELITAAPRPERVRL